MTNSGFKRLLFLAVVATCLNLPAAGFAELPFKTYRNNEHGFSFSFPNEWQYYPPKTGVTVVKIAASSLAEDCVVAVHRSAALHNISTADAVRTMTPSAVVNDFIRNGFSNVNVEENGLTQINNRDAFYVVMGYSIHSMGQVFPSKSLIVITTKRDKVFTVNCGTTDPNTFPEIYPMFRAIIGTFLVDP